jgi:DNA-binding FadR family transcriptional regulator
MMMVEVPEALAKEPLSPVLASQLETIVPSGRVLTGRILPTERAAIQ